MAPDRQIKRLTGPADSSYLLIHCCRGQAHTFLTHPVNFLTQDSVFEQTQIHAYMCIQWHTPCALIAHLHMYPPDKPAFLAGSGPAKLFLSLPFCPGQKNHGMSERHLNISDKTDNSQSSPSSTVLRGTGLLLTTNWKGDHITQQTG